VPLLRRWPSMAIDSKLGCIEAIYQKVKKMVDIKFPAYGSLYSTDAPLDSSSKKNLNDSFCIGPHYGAKYWDCNVGESRSYHNAAPNHGPCKFKYHVYLSIRKLLINFQGQSFPRIVMVSLMLVFLESHQITLPFTTNPATKAPLKHICLFWKMVVLL
jgi:hypothetical protein